MFLSQIICTSPEHRTQLPVFTFLLPLQTYLTNKQTEHSHVVCSDAVWIFLCVKRKWTKEETLQVYKLINLFGPEQMNYRRENALKQ